MKCPASNTSDGSHVYGYNTGMCLCGALAPWQAQQPKTAPYRCPVCEGKGKVPNGFYTAIGVESWATSDITPDTCRSCNGTGVVWR